MNNPFKIIGTALFISIFGLVLATTLPNALQQFDKAHWLSSMIILVLLTLSILISMMNNAQKISKRIKVKSNS